MNAFSKKLPCALLAGTLAQGVVFGEAPAVRYATYLGGTNFEVPSAITAGADGSVYVTGLTGSQDFPGAVPILGGGIAYVAKVRPDGGAVTQAATVPGFFPRAIAVNAAGEIYLAGYTFGSGFPLVNPMQAESGGAFEAVVLKLNAAGDGVLFSTHLGGSGDDGALAIALDADGRIWVAGITTSENFPTAGNPLQGERAGTIDGFLARLSADGSTLEHSTYLGGAEGASFATGLAIDGSGRPVVCGVTSSSQFPTRNAFQAVKPEGADAFIAKFEASGQALVFSTFLGGGGEDSALAVGLDGVGNVHVHGLTRSEDFPTRAAFQGALAGEDDFFVAKLLADGSDLVYSTYLGSSLSEAYRTWPNGFGAAEIYLDQGGIAVTPGGRAVVAGVTQGADFPLVNPLRTTNAWYNLDAIATAFEPDGTVAFSTYLGGQGAEWGVDAAATPDGGFVVGGYTTRADIQPDFPTTAGAAQRVNASQDLDGFLIKLDHGTPPLGNDAFANATTLSGPEVSTLAQSGGASKEAGEPAHNGNAGGKSVWFRWQVPANGRGIISTETSTFPTLLGIYRGTELANLVPVAGAVVDLGTFREARLPVTEGETIYIAVDGQDGAGGTAVLSLTLSLPPNDEFANRILFTGSPATVTGSNIGSTRERGDRAPRNVWWKWRPTAAGHYTMTTLGSDYNTSISVFAGGALDGLSEVAFGANYTNQLGRATFYAAEGTEYQIMVTGDNGETGQIQLNVMAAVRPPNDDFANRTVLTGRNELVTATDFDSGYNPEEWELKQLLGIAAGSGRIVWWEWVAPIDGAAEISTTISTLWHGEKAATSLFVFAGDSIPTDKSAAVAVDAPENGRGAASLFLTDVVAGTRYKIGVDGVEWQQPVVFSLRIRAIAPPRIVAGSARLENGVFRARGEGIEGHNYRVKWSSNLSDWTDVSSHPGITGEFAFESEAGSAYRFYRIEEY